MMIDMMNMHACKAPLKIPESIKLPMKRSSKIDTMMPMIRKWYKK